MTLRILVFIAVTHSTFAIASDAVNLAEATLALQNWQKKIISIRVQSVQRGEEKTNVMIREASLKHTLGNKDWVWEDAGRFREETVAYNDDRLVMREMRLADDKHFYSLGQPGNNPGNPIPIRVTIFPNSPQYTTSGLWTMPHWILWDNKTRTWIGDRISNATQVTVTEDECLQVDGNEISSEANRFRVVLDPKHGYLPKMAEHPDMGSGFTRYVVDEFREVEPGFWFPWRGSMLINANILDDWEVTQVDLNTDLPSSLFVPPIGDETYVVNTITGKQYWHGGEPPAHLLAEKAAAAHPGSPPVNDNPLTGEPYQPANWSLWLVLLGLMLVAGSVWVRRRA